VVHACNSSYSGGGGDWEDGSLSGMEVSLEKKLARPPSQSVGIVAGACGLSYEGSIGSYWPQAKMWDPTWKITRAKKGWSMTWSGLSACLARVRPWVQTTVPHKQQEQKQTNKQTKTRRQKFLIIRNERRGQCWWLTAVILLLRRQRLGGSQFEASLGK
jgi:hypothetical protein